MILSNFFVNMCTSFIISVSFVILYKLDITLTPHVVTQTFCSFRENFQKLCLLLYILKTFKYVNYLSSAIIISAPYEFVRNSMTTFLSYIICILVTKRSLEQLMASVNAFVFSKCLHWLGMGRLIAVSVYGEHGHH